MLRDVVDVDHLLSELVERFASCEPTDERVRLMRYQLLTALAGTLSDAARAGARHALLMLHEFLTDQRPDDHVAANDSELHRFATTVLDCELPDGRLAPWCVEVRAPDGFESKLYVARAVTDLRATTLSAAVEAT